MIEGCTRNAVTEEVTEKEIEDVTQLVNKNELRQQIYSVLSDKQQIKELAIKLEELKATPTCPKCRWIVNADERFCSNCGTKLKTDTETDVCPQCGQIKKAGSAFCIHCGFRFEQKSEKTKERLCVNCGTKLDEDVLFCHVCGYMQPKG